jgi:hypothetical protein
MHVSDEAKLFAVRSRLLEAERKIYEANRIMAHFGESENENFSVPVGNHSVLSDTADSVTGLYPGQLADQTTSCELPAGEIECVE